MLAFGECRLIPASEVKSLQIKGGTPSVGAQGWYRQNVSFFLLRQGKHEVMCTVSLNRPTCSEGTRLVLRLMNIIFGHEKRSKCVPPRPLPSPQRSRGHARAAPSMSSLSSAFTCDSLCNSRWKATLWEELSALLPSHSSRWVHSFLTQAPQGSARPCLTGIKRGRIVESVLVLWPPYLYT